MGVIGVVEIGAAVEGCGGPRVGVGADVPEAIGVAAGAPGKMPVGVGWLWAG